MHNKNIIVLIENLRLHSNEQIELAHIAKNMNLEVRYFDTLKNSLQIMQPSNFLSLEEQYIIFCSIHTLKAIDTDLLESKHNNNVYTTQDLELLTHFKQYIYYDIDLFNDISMDINKYMFNYFEKETINLFSKFKTTKFIKPTTGLKEFPSNIIYENETFMQYIKRTKNRGIKSIILKDYYHNKQLQHTILTTTPKITYNTNNDIREYRFFVINNNIIAQSQYLINNEFECEENIPSILMTYAKRFVTEYTPHTYFVMDIIKNNNNYYVLEYNCINSSGMYACDKQKILEAMLKQLQRGE